MAQYSVEELERLLKISPKLALETFKRFETFHSDEAPSLQALLAYTGMVFKHIAPADFSDEDFLYAHVPVCICMMVIIPFAIEITHSGYNLCYENIFEGID